MNSEIEIVLPRGERIYDSAESITNGLEKTPPLLEPLHNSISSFLTNFNERYKTNFSIDNILDFYNGNDSDLDTEGNIYLCKALLTFILHKGLKVNFDDKSYSLMYKTLLNSEGIINYTDNLTEKNISSLLKLDKSIFSLINKIRDFSSAIVNNGDREVRIITRGLFGDYDLVVEEKQEDNNRIIINNGLLMHLKKPIINELSQGHLKLGDEISISLLDDESFKNDLIFLSKSQANKLFLYLEKLVRDRMNMLGSIIKPLATIIQLSTDRNNSVTQKMYSIKNSDGKITNKFLENNINLTNFRNFILGDSGISSIEIQEKHEQIVENIEEPELQTEPGNINNKEDKNTINDRTEEEKDILIKFLEAFNNFVDRKLKEKDEDGLIDPFNINHFDGVQLDYLFFQNIDKSDENFEYLLEIFNIEELETFLKEWHRVNEIKLKGNGKK